MYRGHTVQQSVLCMEVQECAEEQCAKQEAVSERAWAQEVACNLTRARGKNLIGSYVVLCCKARKFRRHIILLFWFFCFIFWLAYWHARGFYISSRLQYPRGGIGLKLLIKPVSKLQVLYGVK